MQAARTYAILTFIAFTTQGLGISIQQILATFMEKSRMSVMHRKSAIIVFGVAWTYFTMYMFLADLAASKAFQLKLVPVSVVGLTIGRRWPGWIGS
jgi:succinate-acetate transporter protein